MFKSPCQYPLKDFRRVLYSKNELKKTRGNNFLGNVSGLSLTYPDIFEDREFDV